jgi:spore coat polysaccharide biosynthesis protein SpsF
MCSTVIIRLLQFHADVIIRLTADCPLIDPGVIDLTVSAFLGKVFPATQPPSTPITGTNSPDHRFHFAADRLPPPWRRTLPIGLDVEVCSFDSLERAWREARQPWQREHVMPYLYEGVSFQKPTLPTHTGWYLEEGITARRFNVVLLNHHPDYGSLRWTVDTPADLEFVRQVYARFEGTAHFSWLDVLALLAKEPELADLNAQVKHKSAFDVDQRTQI